jgi:hypothetical protein
MRECRVSHVTSLSGVIAHGEGSQVSMVNVSFCSLDAKSVEGTRTTGAVDTMDGAQAQLSHGQLESWFIGVSASREASVQLTKCTVSQSRSVNVLAATGTTVILRGCTVAGSLDCGLKAVHMGARVEARESTSQEQCLCGVHDSR